MRQPAVELSIANDSLKISGAKRDVSIPLSSLRFFATEFDYTNLADEYDEFPIDTLGVVYSNEGKLQRERFTIAQRRSSVTAVLDEVSKRCPQADLRTLSPEEAFAKMGWWSHRKRARFIVLVAMAIIAGFILVGLR
jgi:hypothetical protein